MIHFHCFSCHLLRPRSQDLLATGLKRIPLSMEGVSSELESLLIELRLVFGWHSQEVWHIFPFKFCACTSLFMLSVLQTGKKGEKTIKEVASQRDTEPLLLNHIRIYSCEYHRDRNQRQGRGEGFLPLSGSFRKMSLKSQKRWCPDRVEQIMATFGCED